LEDEQEGREASPNCNGGGEAGNIVVIDLETDGKEVVGWLILGKLFGFGGLVAYKQQVPSIGYNVQRALPPCLWIGMQ